VRGPYLFPTVTVGEPERLNAIGRFLDGLDEPRARTVRGGRIAALAFLTGGLIAIPANVLIEPDNRLVYLMPLLSIVPGLICLWLPWSRMPPSAIHVLAAIGTALVSFSMAVASPAYASYFVYVALFVSLVFPPRAVLFPMLLVCAGLFVPVFVGDFTGRQTLIIALLEAPSLLVLGLITSYLTGRLETGRETLFRLSRRDELTGVGNYRSLHERLAAEVARHGRSESSFALILVDLDGFKEVNERYGHLTGDRVLARVGLALRDGVRAGDMVFRQGGDEFAVIAPESEVDDAEELAQRLRDLLAGCGEDGQRITGATGIAVYPADGRTADDLLSFADAHLLAHKQEGRPAADEA
jgi:diguanylate cyclase (GGDEF)-like protein